MKQVGKIILLLTVLLSTSAYSQTRNYAKEAQFLWASGKYALAADAYKKASEKMKTKTPKSKAKKAEFAFLSGECYRLIHLFPSAEEQYEKAILLEYAEETDPKVYFYLAEMQMAQGEHKKAEGNYKKYKDFNTGDKLVDVRIESCKAYKTFLKNKTRHEMTNMAKLNTVNFDYSTVQNARGTELYFTSSRSAATGTETDQITGQDFTDIFVATIDRKGNFGEPVPLPESINTIDNEGAMCLDGRGKMMFFTRCENEEKMNLGCDIYSVEVKGKKYGEPKKLALKDHDSTHVGHPAVSFDGKTLIFASNMAGGQGGVDLWITTYDRKSESWSLPENMGDEINTAGNEVFPTLTKDGELYYSTDGKVGMGGLDLFLANKTEGENKWTNPTNLGAPLNTYADDYSLIFTQKDDKGQKGYLSSNRVESKGPRENPSQDIWQFVLPPVLVDVMITVFDQQTGDPVPDMEVQVVGSDGSSYVLRTDMDGQINLTEKPDGTRYIEPGNTFNIVVPNVEKKWVGSKDEFTTVDLKRPTTIIREIGVLSVAKPIRLPEVRYALGKWDLLVDSTINSKDSLNYLYGIMIDNPTLIVELMAHTDSRGKNSSNKILSQKRAQSCVNYLVDEKGLPAERFVPRGYGEDVPQTIYEVNEAGDSIAIVLKESYINQFKKTDKTKFEYLHQKNRRTEGKVIGMNYVAKPEAPIDGQ